MKYEISGDTLPVVTINLNRGESIYTQSGGMTWMSSEINMETNMKGGLLKGLGRMLSGESLFMATYTANSDSQFIALAPSFPGHIVALDLRAGSFICQRNSFLCAQPEVALKTVVPNGLKAGLFGGEGFIMQELSGNGMAFLEIDGSVKELALSAGEKIIVNTGNVAAYESSVSFSAQMIKGFKNILFGGEGLFLTTLVGPGKVYLQSMALPSFVERIVPFLPKPRNPPSR